jgi:alkylhydroperoxidase/carboxymuconolactone decarboxylase family protein YurZ
MEERERVLRRLALGDYQSASNSAIGDRPLDPKTQSLVQLGALLGSDAALITIQRAVREAVTKGGVTADDIVQSLVELVPMVGIARVASVAPKLGLALGYDLEAAFEAV